MPFGASGRLGSDFTRIDTAQKHELGSFDYDNEGGAYVYVKAGGAIAVKDAVMLETGFVGKQATTGKYLFGVAVSTLALNEFGWIKIRGKVIAKADTALNAGDGVASVIITTAGRVSEPVAVNEGGATSHGVGRHSSRGVGLVNEASNEATIYLF